MNWHDHASLHPIPARQPRWSNAGGGKMESQHECQQSMLSSHLAVREPHTYFCLIMDGKMRGCSSPGTNTPHIHLWIVISIYEHFKISPCVPLCLQAYWHTVGVDFCGGTAMSGNSKSGSLAFHMYFQKEKSKRLFIIVRLSVFHHKWLQNSQAWHTLAFLRKNWKQNKTISSEINQNFCWVFTSLATVLDSRSSRVQTFLGIFQCKLKFHKSGN